MTKFQDHNALDGFQNRVVLVEHIFRIGVYENLLT